GWLGQALLAFGVTPGELGAAYGGRLQASWIAGLLAIALLLPNTQQIMTRFEPGLGLHPDTPNVPRRLQWRPSAAWAVGIAVLLAWSFLHINRPSDFLYWQF